MGKLKHDHNGFGSVELLLVIIIVAIIGFVGWYVARAKHNTDKTLGTAGSSQVSGSGTDNQSLDSDLNGINNANSQSSRDLNASSSAINDNSTFTALP